MLMTKSKRTRTPPRSAPLIEGSEVTDLKEHSQLHHMQSLTKRFHPYTASGECWARKSTDDLEPVAKYVTFLLPCGTRNSLGVKNAAAQAAYSLLREKLFHSDGTLFDRLLGVHELRPSPKKALVIAFPLTKPLFRDTPQNYVIGLKPVGCAVIDYDPALAPEELRVKGSAELQVFVKDEHRNKSLGTAMVHHASALKYTPTFARPPMHPRHKRFLELLSLVVHDSL